MAAPESSIWIEANQRYLAARLALVRALLDRRGSPDTPRPAATTSTESAELAVRVAAQAMPSPAALDELCAAFELSPFERDVLLICAGDELDSSFRALWSGRAPRLGPTFSEALASLPGAHWSALTPAAPLRHWRLVEVGSGDTLATSILRIDERVLHYLTGISYLDERLHGFVERQLPPADLPPSHRARADRIVELWSQSAAGGLPIVHLGGGDVGGKRSVAAAACEEIGMELKVMRAADVPTNPADRQALARLWEREAILGRVALLLETGGSEQPSSLSSFLDQIRAPLFVAASEPLDVRRRAVVRFDVEKPTPGEQRQLWQIALGPLAERLDGRLEALVSQFDLGASEIDAAGELARAGTVAEQGDVGDRLWDGCRRSSRGRLDGLAQRIEPVAEWSDLVMPPAQLAMLRDIAAHVSYRTRVYDTWGFSTKSTRGLGISVLFVGASGTGKTMAAEILAQELRLDLYRIDLSQVVSKYIGETEKNLRRVFEAAEASGAVLLFDEADALFGKRSDVKDSHDRYANIEISYLLQRMESYRGLAILTTNMKTALDPAFLRRLRFVVQFPFPDTALRAEIWRRIYPSTTPVADLDPMKLARLNVSGGNIHNIALQAAFIAAERNSPVTMAHVLRAARNEYIKLETALTDSEIAGWA